MLPKAPDLGLLLVRTDYSDDAAWQAALTAATAVYDADNFERMGACLRPVESPELEHLTPEDLMRLPREDYLGELAVDRRLGSACARVLLLTGWRAASGSALEARRPAETSALAATSETPTADVHTGFEASYGGHGSSEKRELAAVVVYRSGKDGQRCEAHSDHVACFGGTGGI
jgi:hypothetical protein